MTHYEIRRISALSALKIGVLVGSVASLLPGFLLGLLLRWGVGTLRGWLESWTALTIPLTEVRFSLVDAMQLTDLLSRLQQFDERGVLLVVLVLLVALVLGGLLNGLFWWATAVLYNLITAVVGGLVVDMQGHGQVAATVHPGSTFRLESAPPASPTPAAAAIAPSAIRAWLIPAQQAGPQLPLAPGSTTIGSAPGNQIMLPGLAARHAEVRLENGRYILYDFSQGQTWVNGRALTAPNMLKPGFRVRLGSQEFLFQSE